MGNVLTSAFDTFTDFTLWGGGAVLALIAAAAIGMTSIGRSTLQYIEPAATQAVQQGVTYVRAAQ